MKKKILMTLFIFTILLSGCGTKSEDISDSQNTVENAEAQDEAYVLTFEGTTVDGDIFTSDCFADSKLTMINVWATFCGPCLDEMPDLGAIAASYDKAEFQMVGVISDVVVEASEEEVQTAKELIEETGANYPHLLVNESLYTNLVGGIEVVPTTFFVNQKGEVLGYLTGSMPKENWEEIINGLLEEME